MFGTNFCGLRSYTGNHVLCTCTIDPKVPDWKQDHFFGMKSFFNRTFDNGGFLAEREYGMVKFKTTKGEEKEAKLMFLSGKVVEQGAKACPHGSDRIT